MDSMLIKKWLMKILKITVRMVLAIFVGLGIALYFLQTRMVYYPITNMQTDSLGCGIACQDVYFTAADGVKLNGWYMPVKDSNMTVLFCHGNGGNISYYTDTLEIFRGLGVSCFIFDYRGYGRSESTPSEQGTYDDALGAYEWLTKTKGIDPNDIIVVGRSLGGSIATKLASMVRVKGLIVESSFTSIADVGSKIYPYMPVRLLCRYGYNTVDFVKQVHRPVLVIHSPDDEMIPFEMGETLFQAANEPKQFLQIRGSHNEGFLESGQVYMDTVGAWLKSLN